MNRLVAFCCLLGAGLVGTSAHAQSSPTEQRMIHDLALPANAKITYLDRSGQPISFAEFMKLARHGSFSADKDFDAHTATLQIDGSDTTSSPPTLKLALKPGDALPPFKLASVRGTTVSNADIAGHYTLLSFYFAECAPCIAELPALNALAREDKQLHLLSVTYEPRDTANTFARQHGSRLDGLVDAQAFIDAVGVTTYPTLLLVDPHGRVAAAAISTSLAKKGGTPTTADISHWVNQHRTR